MSLLDSIFGGGAETTASVEQQDDQRYAILLNAGPDQTPVAGNGFNYATELAAAGYEVELYLDGEATKWPATYAENPDHPFHDEWDRIVRSGILAGACGYCANAFDVADAYDDADAELLSDATDHAPEIAQLADDGYELLTIG
ncbi:DsrE family protein [Halomicrobium sp. LC1Hm]|uniref:DsrE family protein n=1 Tax=Halomicrobium sp. LC1Hm TaxID=2610902 RepID=UPI001885EA47|nr:DsrE family protein [Halomicrobium sp. LC1Hm]